VSTSERCFAGVAALSLLALLIVAARLEPSAKGHGTHTALGMPPCSWASLTGYPCPTCGMTTAFAHAADGNLATAFLVQPMGALIALAASAGVWIAGHVAVTGSFAARAVARGASTPALWGTLAILLGSWVYKLLTWSGF
jgi:hypothetical protein